MKIIVIEKAAADTERNARYDSASFDNAVREALGRGIAPVGVDHSDASAYRVYTGTDRASIETAEALFETTGSTQQTALLNDVPLRAFRDTENTYPCWIWQTMGKVQWYMGNPRQAEARAKTLRRAHALLEQLEAEEKDCVLITGGLMKNALLDALGRRGYYVEGERRTKPLARVRATKRNLHCGGCMHNCLLSDPGCAIGKDKARREM